MENIPKIRAEDWSVLDQFAADRCGSRTPEPSRVASSAWLAALRETKEGVYRVRVRYYDAHAKNPPGYNEVMTAISEAVRLTESAANAELCHRPNYERLPKRNERSATAGRRLA